MKGACERVGMPLDQVEDIVAGCVNPAHEGMGDVARWAALAAGFPDSVAGATINRFCGSSLSATINIAHAIKAGDLGVGIACWVESMSRSGWALMKGDARLQPARPGIHARHHVGRCGRPTEPDSVGSQRLHRDDRNRAEGRRPLRVDPRRDRRVRVALSATRQGGPRSGRLAKEIMPVTIPGTRKTPERLFEHDEFIRDDTTAETLANLPAQPGTTQMTAANSTPLTDGASAIVLARARRPLNSGSSRWPGWFVGCVRHRSVVMGLAPAWAMPLAISRAGLTPQQIDVWEVHEAFSAQALGVLRELPNQLDGFTVPDDKLTPNGGAVAIGHPFGASGLATC